jgi:hypothetical protein
MTTLTLTEHHRLRSRSAVPVNQISSHDWATRIYEAAMNPDGWERTTGGPHDKGASLRHAPSGTEYKIPQPIDSRFLKAVSLYDVNGMWESIPVVDDGLEFNYGHPSAALVDGTEVEGLFQGFETDEDFRLFDVDRLSGRLQYVLNTWMTVFGWNAEEDGSFSYNGVKVQIGQDGMSLTMTNTKTGEQANRSVDFLTSVSWLKCLFSLAFDLKVFQQVRGNLPKLPLHLGSVHITPGLIRVSSHTFDVSEPFLGTIQNRADGRTVLTSLLDGSSYEFEKDTDSLRYRRVSAG